MLRLFRRLHFLSMLCVVVAGSLHGNDYLMVFHENETASIYDADSLDLLGTPTVGPGAVRAFGIPNPSDPDELLKIYVLRRDAVVVLSPDPPFDVLATRLLPAAISMGEQSAVLTPDAGRLLVMSGNFLQVFDTRDPSHPSPTSLPLSAPVTGVAARIDSRRAYVSTENSETLRIVSLASSPPQLLAGPLELPQVPGTLTSAPNGFGIFAFAEQNLFEIDPFRNEIRREIETLLSPPAAFRFDPDAPIETAFLQRESVVTVYDMISRELGDSFFPISAVLKAVSPGQELIYLLLEFNGELSRIDRNSGVLSPVDNPSNGFPFGKPAVDLEVNHSDHSVFFAFTGPGSVARVNTAGTLLLGEVNLSPPPTGIEIVSTPGQFGADLEVYGGNEQLGEIGEPFARPLAVRVLDNDERPVFRQEVTFSSDDVNVSINPVIAFTDAFGVAHTRVSPTTNEVFEVEAHIEPADESVFFDLNLAPSGTDGIFLISGDYQYVLEGEPFPLPIVVETRRNGQPQPEVDLMIDAISSSVTCPAMVTTDEDGRAEFTCMGEDVGFKAFSDIRIEDEFGRRLEDRIHVTVVGTAAELPTQTVLLSRRNISGIVDSTLTDAVSVRVTAGTGFVIENLGIQFDSGGRDFQADPELAVTNSLGVATTDVVLGCDTRGGLTGTLSATGLPEFEVGVRTETGPPALVTKVRGDNQSGTPGEQLVTPLVGVVTDICGTRLGGLPIVWDVQPEGAATLISPFATTNAVGELSTGVRLGSTSQRILINARIGDVGTTFRASANVAPTQILAVQGDNQTIGSGQPAAMPLVVETRTSDGAPAGGVPLTFRVTAGSATLAEVQAASSFAQGSGGAPGSLQGSPSLEVVTDSEGRASAGVIGGEELGLVIVEARAGNLVIQFRLTVVGRMPVVSSTGIVNGASFVPGIVPGSLASIFGTGITQALDGVLQADTAPFPLGLGGVQVSVAGVPAPMISIANVNGQEQLNIQVPTTVPTPSSNVSVTIDNNGASATTSGIVSFAVQPGIFQVTLPEGLFAAALHSDFSLVSPSNPARPGDIILLFLTGLGPTNPAVGTNVAGPSPPAVTLNDPSVTVDGAAAEVLGSFYAPTLFTVYQINLRIPESASVGNLSIQAEMLGVLSQESVIPVGP